jgi:glycosyltransferase involved in cell wall biosynthesis
VRVISVIIPVFNREDLIGEVLEAILSNSDRVDDAPGPGDDTARRAGDRLHPLADHPDVSFEVIVVDDCSRDGTVDAVRRYPAKIVQTEGNAGPSAARNVGAGCSRGEILVFVDSDVVIRPDTLGRIVGAMDARPELGGVAGITSLECPHSNFLTRYQNTFLRYRYLWMEEIIATPWASLMAVRRDAFEAVDGFDEGVKTYEDYDIGYRLGSVDALFYLDKDLDFVHHKKFRFRRLFTDYLRKVANMFSYHLHMRLGGRKAWEAKKPHTWHGHEPHFPPLPVGMPRGAILDYIVAGPAIFNFIVALALGGFGLYFWISLGLLLLGPLWMTSFWLYLLRVQGLWFTVRGMLTQPVLVLVAELAVVISIVRALFGKTTSDFLGASK